MADPFGEYGAEFFRGAPDLHEADLWDPPDLRVLEQHRRTPPHCPLDVLGPDWEPWIKRTAAIAACPFDYAMAPLLAVASALIGHSRWVEVVPGGWREPPHLW